VGGENHSPVIVGPRKRPEWMDLGGSQDSYGKLPRHRGSNPSPSMRQRVAIQTLLSRPSKFWFDRININEEENPQCVLCAELQSDRKIVFKGKRIINLSGKNTLDVYLTKYKMNLKSM